ncbi:MAG: carbohydrate kinase family protein [Candidatus Woesearchaeota archaeon]|nr:carbohydrate kinase family protein [Candidatus Woesearchaeota archaeon]
MKKYSKKSFEVLTLGAATVDVFVNVKPEFRKDQKHEDACFPIGSKMLIDSLHTDTGGGGTNTASSFARLGLKTGWIGALGNDVHSKIVSSALNKEGVREISKAKNAKTGYSVILTRLHSDRIILAFKGANDLFMPADISWKNLKTTWLYCSSMTGKSQKTLEHACLWAKKNRVKYAVNLSQYLAKQGMKKLKHIITNCDVLILNKEEAKALANTKNGSVDILLKILQQSTKIVVITDGSRGAISYDGSKKYEIKARKIRVIETTGAGDAFASGFVAGLYLYRDIERAMQLGLAQSEAVIQQIGAKKGLLTLQQAEKVMRKPAKMRITKI